MWCEIIVSATTPQEPGCTVGWCTGPPSLEPPISIFLCAALFVSRAVVSFYPLCTHSGGYFGLGSHLSPCTEPEPSVLLCDEQTVFPTCYGHKGFMNLPPC